jgi:DNA modification methylase
MINIQPYSDNAKKHPDKQLKQIAASLVRFGWQQPIVVDKQGIIIVGHGRYAAWQKYPEGMTEPWITDNEGVVLQGKQGRELTKQEIKAYRLADNKLNESDWDLEMAIEELHDIDDAALQELTGFDMDLLLEPEEADDAVPGIPEEPKSKLGDLYQLGPHRVLCGDSTKLEDVERLMDGKKADMVFTDPPYKLQTDGGTNQPIGKAATGLGKTIEFISNFEPADFLNVLPIFFEKNMNAYIFCNKELLPDYLVWARDAGYSFNVLVWKKPNAIPIGDSHRPDIEYLLLFRKNAIWNNGLSASVNYSRLIESPRETGLHPTMKPVGIITNQLQISSHTDSIVVDTFLGSGSTLIASEKTGRICYGMELDGKYCDVIVERWCKYTGITKIKKNGVEMEWKLKSE